MKKYLFFHRIILCILLVLLAQSTTAQAQIPPPLPSGFYGIVRLSGEYVPVGTEISAWIGDVRHATTHTVLYQGMSVYSLDMPGDIPGTTVIEGGKDNETIVFKIGDITADETAVWHSGTNVSHNLNGTGSLLVEYFLYLPITLKAR